MRTAKSQPTWTLMKAAAAGGGGLASLLAATYQDYSAELDHLAAAVNAADENLGG